MWTFEYHFGFERSGSNSKKTYLYVDRLAASVDRQPSYNIEQTRTNVLTDDSTL